MKHLKPIFEVIFRYKMKFDTKNDKYWTKIKLREYRSLLDNNEEKMVQISDQTKFKIEKILGYPVYFTDTLTSSKYLREGPGLEPKKIRGYGVTFSIPGTEKSQITIHEIEDEYFLINYAEWDSEEFDMVYYFFKCDQFDGLKKFFEDKELTK